MRTYIQMFQLGFKRLKHIFRHVDWIEELDGRLYCRLCNDWTDSEMRKFMENL